jgi:RecA-family ATPase
MTGRADMSEWERRMRAESSPVSNSDAAPYLDQSWHAGLQVPAIDRTVNLKSMSRRKMTLDLTDKTLVGGLINKGEVSVMVGPPGVGKTWLSIHLAIRITEGRPFMGREVEKGGVAIFAAEAGEALYNRVLANGPSRTATPFPTLSSIFRRSLLRRL